MLEEDIQTTLRHNYLGTRQLLLLARRMPRLAAFTHVSSTYSNIDLPTGATGEERVYPLRFGDREVDHADQVRAERRVMRGTWARMAPQGCQGSY